MLHTLLVQEIFWVIIDVERSSLLALLQEQDLNLQNLTFQPLRCHCQPYPHPHHDFGQVF